MKSLWIVNKCCGALHQKLYGKKATGGQWLDAMLEEARGSEHEIVVVNIEKKPQLSFYQDANVTYYTLKGEPNAKYAYRSKKSVDAWRSIIEKEKPDIIELWGTEFPYGMAATEAAPDIPVIIYVQGILDSIAKYYLSGLSATELRVAKTLRDVMTGTTIHQMKRDFERRTVYEAELLRRAGHIIVENRWAEAYCRKTVADVKAHFLPISISDSFSAHTWSKETMRPHTIMCSAANYPIKGLHMLLKALSIVKKHYPDVQLYIPGTVLKDTKSLKARLKQNGYDRLIRKMIKDLGLSENVSYTGRLTAEEMAEKMASVNCFAMCSAIENHSSTLKEAMTVGTPCVASYVGGVPEYAVDGENCLLHRFEDYEVLAQNICRVFADKDLRANLSQNAKDLMRKPKEETDFERMIKIFERVIEDAR